MERRLEYVKSEASLMTAHDPLGAVLLGMNVPAKFPQAFDGANDVGVGGWLAHEASIYHSWTYRVSGTPLEFP